MREILFRGKRIDSGKWTEGGYKHEKVGEYFTAVFVIEHLTSEVWENHRVDPATVGQFTGMTDKNGKKIFEGDIIEWDELEWGSKHREVVTWDYNLFAIRKDDWGEWCEVIGNIHDTPELLEGGAEDDKPL